MAKDRRKVIHIHSSIEDRQPTPQSLEYGELGVNYNAGNEFISTKNSNDKIVRFSSDERVVTIMEKKEVMPYDGMVRGETGPDGTKDDKGSYGITNNDLLNNKSNLIIKLNQVAAGNTTKHDKVNGSKDIYNKLVNPTADAGLNDGAGFAIDMSRYAMIDANPSFSSLTVTDKTDLSGNTTISNGDGTGTRTGYTFNIETTDVVTNNTNWTETITNKAATITNANISATTTDYSGGTLTITTTGNTEINSSADTHINSVGNTAIHSDGKLGITSKGELMAISTEGDMVVTANGSICESAGDNIGLAGVNNTYIGKSCSGDIITTGDTIIYGGTNVNISGETINNSSTYYNITGETNIVGDTTIGGTLILNTGLEKTLSWSYGDVKIAGNCTSGDSTNFVSDKCFTIPKDNSHINRRKVSWTYDNVCNANGGEYDPGQTTDGSFKIPSSAAHIKRQTLSWTYGDVKQESNSNYDPGANTGNSCTADTSFVIPKSVGDMNRYTLSYSYGSVSAKSSSDDGTYDPGDASDSIVIPTCIAELKNWNGSCYSLDGDVCVTGDVTATGSFYSTSDERKKENIDYIDKTSKYKVANIPLKSFNYKEDASKKKMYGVIAQDVEAAGLNELVHTDEQGMKAVDYTSLLILRIAHLESMITQMHKKLVDLEDKVNGKDE